MKALITGSSGQLGYDIVRELEKRNITDYIAPTSKEMDITNEEQVRKLVLNYRPDVIFHCAAYTNVDQAEVDIRKCELVNIVGTKNITEASMLIKAKLIYISTDYIFDGTKKLPYLETDKPNPQNIYGKTKYLGELKALQNPETYIVRISWVFGINGNNFIKTMLKLSEKYDTLNVVNDQIGSPTYTKDLAPILVDMALSNKYGIYNCTNNGFCSWSDFAKYIMKIGDKKTLIIPVTTEEYYQNMAKIVAPRPKNSCLNKDKLEREFGPLPSWQDATNRFIAEINSTNELQRKLK